MAGLVLLVLAQEPAVKGEEADVFAHAEEVPQEQQAPAAQSSSATWMIS